MSEQTLENVVREALAYAEGSCTIAFQGGEPTLRGLDFFKKLIEYQKKYNRRNVRIQNALQTNGYKLNEVFIKFLAGHDFLTGISLDGSKDTHDAYRKTPSGETTFFNVIETIDLFKKHGAEFNILTVVNAKTGKKARKIYSFYQRNGMSYLQFIPCLDPLNETPGSNGYSLSPEVYGQFLSELFEVWHEDLLAGKQPYIRQFENFISILAGYGAESCDMLGVCGKQYVVEADGGVYPCDFFVLPEFKLGNLNEQTILEIDEERKRLGFIQYSASIREGCRTCEYFPVCRGGCRRHRLIRDADGNYQNYFCKSYKIFFKNALGRMIDIAEKIRASGRIGT